MFLSILSSGWQPRWPRPERLAVFVIALSVLLLLPVVYAGIFNHPLPGDDFENATWSNFGAVLRHDYVRWTGRYFAIVVLLIGPWHWYSLVGFQIVLILLLLVFVAVITWLIAKALTAYTTAPRPVAIAAGLSAVLLVVNNMDSLMEGFFWYAGAYTYTFPAMLLAVLFGIMMRVDRDADTSPSVPQYGLAAALIIMIIGCNETILVLCDLACFSALLYSRREKLSAATRFYLFLCAVCLVCSAVAILAPGNFARQADSPRNVWMVPPTWLYFTQKIALRWLLDPFLFLYSVVFLLLLGRYRLRRPITNLLVAFLVPFALFFVLSFPGHFVLGTRPPARVYNTAYLFFVFGWIFFLLHLAYYLNVLSILVTLNRPLLRQVACILLITALLISANSHDLRRSNIFQVIKQLAMGKLQRYDAEMHHRYVLIRQRTTDTLALPAIRSWDGNILTWIDVTANPAMTRNKVYAAYWHIPAVYVMPDTVQHSDQLR